MPRVCSVGERQSWAAPSVPNVQIVDNSDLLKSKPYGTFKQQVKHTPANNQVKTSDVDDQSSKPSSEEITSTTSANKTKDLDVDEVNADDSMDESLQKSGAVTGSGS